MTTEGTVDITITPINDNKPELTNDGSNLAASGIEYDEDEHLPASPVTLILSELFRDLDIDEDGLIDSSTSGDNDSLDFAVVGNTNTTLIDTNFATPRISRSPPRTTNTVRRS
ncbi:MAG: hypothetical protein U5O39_04285 [Gammaproteobacteria bacterium]|nr:hypothetical protein [Gammaproteobacteria bacterium]